MISDNASTDGTLAIRGEYARRDDRIRDFRNARWAIARASLTVTTKAQLAAAVAKRGISARTALTRELVRALADRL